MLKLFLNNYILIFLGCGIGGVLRYIVSNRVNYWSNHGFPYGTLTVNITGSLLAGLIFTIILKRPTEFSASLIAFLMIGILGGYTTFSTFSIETIKLLEQKEFLQFFFNIGSNLALCITAAWLGIILGRSL